MNFRGFEDGKLIICAETDHLPIDLVEHAEEAAPDEHGAEVRRERHVREDDADRRQLLVLRQAWLFGWLYGSSAPSLRTDSTEAAKEEPATGKESASAVE